MPRLKNAMPPVVAFLLRIPLTLALALLLYCIRRSLPEDYMLGADCWFMYDLIQKDPFPLYYRSLLTVLAHRGVYVLGHPFGLDGWYAMAFSSSLAGAVALQVLWAMRPHWLFLAVNVLAGSFFVFVGHVENYAWVNAFFLLMLWAARRWLDGEAPLWPATTFFVLACLSHMLALFYLPALVYLLWKERRYDPLEVVLPLLVFSLVLAMLNLFFEPMGTDNGLERLVPLLSTWAPNHHFTFFSWNHLKMLLFFHHKASILWIPAELLRLLSPGLGYLWVSVELPLLLVWRRRIDTLYLRFLLACVLCGLVWTTIWHPDWGKLDWDLFSQVGIPLHVLLGLLVLKDERFVGKKNTNPAQSG